MFARLHCDGQDRFFVSEALRYMKRLELWRGLRFTGPISLSPWYHTTALNCSPVKGWIMLANSLVAECGGCALPGHLAIARGLDHERIFVPPQEDLSSPIGMSGLPPAARAARSRATPVNHAVAEKPRTFVELARAHLRALHWQ